MRVAIVTVGDELLAGETTNTNASWLAGELADRGATVERIVTVPDDRPVIADYVRRWSETFDAVIATGGVGGTPDDVTMEAVADALDRDLVVHEDVREQLVEKGRTLRENRPELFEEYDLQFDLEEAASVPAGAEPIVTDAGFAPGCVVENVSVFAGFPDEMRAAFGRVADRFAGDRITRTVFTPEPEGAVNRVLEPVADQFDVSIGSYPTKDDRPARVRVAGTDDAVVDAAVEWLTERIETVDGAVDEGITSEAAVGDGDAPER